MNSKLKIGFIVAFILLYVMCALISGIHSISFFELTNSFVMAVVLSLCFEIGQAATLFTILLDKKKKLMPWVLMILLTAVQVFGNVYHGMKYMMTNSTDDIQYFTISIVQLFFTDVPIETQNVITVWIQGAILPIVALMLTAMVHNLLIGDSATITEQPQNNTQPNDVVAPVTTPDIQIVPQVDNISNSTNNSTDIVTGKPIIDTDEPIIEPLVDAHVSTDTIARKKPKKVKLN